ncbi:MAG: RelA/SpoT family protein [Pseudomonadota bacterium]
MKAGDEPRFLISDLLTYLEHYLPTSQVKKVYDAYLFGADAHVHQKRLSGEPYIYHPIAVARILAGMHLDHKCLIAAILHDVIEDTSTAKDEIAGTFDPEVAELVDGVTKLAHLDFESKAEAQAASFRKMMLAMTRDIRVILIKLADRLHNMRTLGVMPPDKARRIARETLEIYAPIANRLGINAWRHELDDLAFQAYWPWRYRIVADAVSSVHGKRRETLASIESAIRRGIMQEGIQGEVYGREKHLYSVYRKMRDRKVPFNEIADVFAFRVVVDRVDTCYRVLGLVHHLFKPIPGRFKDYIAIPKANGYQSLHTVLFGSHGGPIEIQIRTEAMHRVAESGVAAHWQYKSGEHQDRSSEGLGTEWLQDLLELQRGSGSPLEFLEHVKVDLFPDEVYVFTPRGKILVLPRGATVVDFAYAVHSDVGNACVAARVDRQLVPLRTALRNGETVDIMTSPNARPNARWLDFVVTSKARAAIRNFLKNLQFREAVQLGEQLLNSELKHQRKSLSAFPVGQREHLAKELGRDSWDTLVSEVGLGNRPARLIARRLLGEDVAQADSHAGGELAISGTEGMVVNFAKCCHPIPGDPIVATFSRGRGIVVHHQACPNLASLGKSDDRWLDVRWEEDVSGEFAVAVRVEANNRRGVLATIAAAIAEMGSNIDNVRTEDHDARYTTIDFVLTVSDRDHLARLVRGLRRIPEVIRLSRTMG